MQSRRQRKAVCGARDINTLRRASAERSLTCANAQELHIQPQVSHSMLERMPKRWTLDVERRNAASPLPRQSWVGRDCCRHATVVKPDVQSPRFVDFPSALPSPVSEQPTRAFSLSRPAQRQAATPSSCSRGYMLVGFYPRLGLFASCLVLAHRPPVQLCSVSASVFACRLLARVLAPQALAALICVLRSALTVFLQHAFRQIGHPQRRRNRGDDSSGDDASRR